jgi:chemotaxis protein MotB
MLELLTQHFALDPKRFAVVGFSDQVPVASNDSEEGRSRNRRVDIVVLNSVAVDAQPFTRTDRP